MYASQVWATPFLGQGKEMGLYNMAADGAQEDLDGQLQIPSWCIMRGCGLDSRPRSEPLQFNLFQAAVRLYNALTRSNSSTARKILQADMQLSSCCDDCWSSHILSAMNGLTQSCLFKERLLKCEPIDLGRFIWTSGRGTWIIGHLILRCIHVNTTANAPLIINGVPP